MKKQLERFNSALFLKVVVFVVLLARIILMFQPSFKIDMNDWQAWAARLVEVGPFNFYSANFFADYFPFFYLSLFILAKIFVLFFGKAAIFSFGFEAYIKIISNVFDVLTALIIYRIINKHSKKWAPLGSILYLLNPSVIFNSSVWGQIDAIPTFLLVFSLYQLEEKKNIIKSSVTSVLSFLIKPLNISLFPLMLLRIINNFSFQKILIAFGVSLATFFIVTIPFFPKDPFFGPFKHLANSLDVYPYTSLNAYNFWSFFGWWVKDSLQVFGISYHLWGYILFFLIIGIVFIPLFRKKIKSFSILDYLIYTILSFAFFLFLTRIHERHLFPVFSLLIISASVLKSKILLIVYLLLSLINFLNIFYSYYYYNFVYSNSSFSNNILYIISLNYQLFFSVLSLILFGIMLFVYYKNQKLIYEKK